MKKNKINSKFHEYVKEKISPTHCYDRQCKKCDKCFVTSVYESFKIVLNQNCIQIGSYPRFTAIKPLHDLDILYILGNWEEQNHNPQSLLEEIEKKLNIEYINPTKYKAEISLQTHSVTIVFKDTDNSEVFSVDVVPAYIFSKNEFDQDTYKVPEVLRKKHGRSRKNYYKKLQENNKEMNWIKTDPKGYIEVAKLVNNYNQDFRKTVKFLKSWKNSCKEIDQDFKLKSFHIEQVITKYFKDDQSIDIFDAIFKFFINISEIINQPNIIDRGDSEKYIDEYLNKLTDEQREKIKQARDGFLKKLEIFSETDSVEMLIEAYFYKRVSSSEQFLFDFKIPVLIDENYSFKIYGEVQEREGSFRKYILNSIGLISTDRKIKFRIYGNTPNVDLFKWKVRNDDNSSEPRGEITDSGTRNDPENTKFQGNHYVECYAILNNICVAKGKQNIKLD